MLHKERVVDVDLDRFEFGMSDADILMLLEGLRDKQVAVVEAGTGTGKSTFMPFRLMRPPNGAALDLTRHGPIVVTEPRRAAAKGVARFVGEELCLGHDSRKCGDHIGPGFGVGYQVSGEQNWDGACQLIYVTDGTMINWVRDGRVARLGAVIIDEAHERSENIDIILTQLREKLTQYPQLRVIITSATLDRSFFVEYFGGADRVFHMAVPATKSFGYGVPLFVDLEVGEHPIENGVTIEDGSGGKIAFEGWNSEGPETEGFAKEDLRATTRAVAQLRTGQRLPMESWKDEMPAALAEQVVAIAAGTDWGDILGFLPTTAAIERSIERIEEKLRSQGLKKAFDVYPLLATTDRGISEKATAARSRGEKRKIVVSSNLAETSLTVKGVRFVVDSGLICQPEWDPELASGSYPTRPHSRSGVRQRWGRVGRDAPGWVFPLYTVDQFFEMGGNTPPGSAQTNLETFWMKLMAAGVEQDAAVLPVSFRHESIVPDTAGLRVRETFERESNRARGALRATGATDPDGHLTEYGRDLERFPGTGSEALALMLAEQLACVHEVALALHVLGGGVLFGRRDDCLLQVNSGWPAAWRVGALQRHTGLAVGCADDLDLLLRVVSLWQAAENRGDWCAQWWINEPALEATWGAAMETVESLSAAMKGEAYRQVDPTLAHRVRGILTHSMVSARYVRKGDDGFEAGTATADKPEVVQLSRGQLMEVGDTILAFHRFRVGDGRALISHVVRTATWASDVAKSDEAGLDLLIRAAENRWRAGLEDPRIQAAQAAYPVGCAVDLTLDPERAGAWPVRDICVVGQPFPRPRLKGSEDDEDAESDDESGGVREWDPVGRDTDASVPEEELEARVLDPRRDEANDDRQVGGATSIGGSKWSPQPEVGELSAVALSTTMPLAQTMQGTVVGYRPARAGVTLVIQPLGEGTAHDPAQHPDLEPGDTISVVVVGNGRDQEQLLVQLMRADGRGHFYG
ncbi:MAG: DEAD/DEAH box helicase, partial [Gemmatimonadales bacterium]|nr:DEAD/DEAH box helicase [Gemmatimonadales bacterium]